MGSDPEFEAVFDGLFARAYRHALRLVGEPALAEDLASEALARTYAHWRRVRAYDHLDAWVLRVVTADVAASLGVAPGTVKLNLHRAVERLRASLGPTFDPRFEEA